MCRAVSISSRPPASTSSSGDRCASYRCQRPTEFCVQRLPHLPRARCRHDARGAVKVQAAGFPIQAEKVDQAAALFLECRDHLLVADFQHPQRQAFEPVRLQSLHGEPAPAAIGEVVGPEIAVLQHLEEAGEAGVARIAGAEDHARAGEQRRDHTEVEDVVGQLVHDAEAVAAQRREPCQMRIRHLPRIEPRPVLHGNLAHIAPLQRHHHPPYVGQLAGTVGRTVAGDDLLDQG